MSTPWIFSSTFLPVTGEPVDFLLEDREEPIHGTFDGGGFHSRWANYDSTRVRSWRRALLDPEHEAIVRPSISAGRKVFAAVERAAQQLMGKGRHTVPAIAENHARRTAPSAQRIVGAAGPTQQQVHSNQISS